jgi:DNA repair exonuclease SbcCD ATPase subunit
MNQSSQPSEPFSTNVEFMLELEELERSLKDLKERYTQVQTDKNHQAHLQRRLKELQLPEMKAELAQIKQQLEVLEINLESQLFSWDKPFWQIVRFGGLGVVVGWILKSCVG